MGKRQRPWQDVEYVLGYFGRTTGQAKRTYRRFMNEGMAQGRREELTGGGLIRSLNGWAEVKALKRRGGEHVMSDERILGDSEFVGSVLSQAHEVYERRYELERQGYDVDRIAKRVAEIYGMDQGEVLSRGKQKRKVQARSLLCFWAVEQLGVSLRDLARKLEMSPPAIGYSVERGKAIARENGYLLID